MNEKKKFSIKDLINNTKNLINQHKIENENYNKLMSQTQQFVDFHIIEQNDKPKNEGRIYEINSKCPSINIDNATKIDNLLPNFEWPICAVHISQDIDNTPFNLILTPYRIWVIATNSYRIFQYNEISIQVIMKGIMNQKLWLNNIMISAWLNTEDLNIFINFITNVQYRNNYIIEDLKYLEGITPVYQCINKNQSGISVDKDKNIVFHDRKINNYKYNYDEIQDYDLLVDTNIVLRKRQFKRNSTLKANTSSCTSVSLRITLKDQRQTIIPILVGNGLNQTYSTVGDQYKEAYNFGKTIIEYIDTLNPNKYL